MSFEVFQDGRHLGYGNRLILAILSLYLSKALHQVSAQSDLLFGIRCRLKNFKIVLAQSNLPLEILQTTSPPKP